VEQLEDIDEYKDELSEDEYEYLQRKFSVVLSVF